MTKRRDINQDLLRLILMILVVFHHGLLRIIDSNSIIYRFIFCFAIVIINNCFFMQSGYFHLRFNWKKLISLVFRCFCSMLIWEVIININNKQAFNTDFFIYLAKNLLTCFDRHWFISTYIILMLISPFLYNMLESLDNRKTQSLILALFTINTVFGFLLNHDEIGTGKGISQAIFMYTVGYYIKDNKETIVKKCKRRIALLAYIAIASFMFFLSTKLSENTFSRFAYENNPLAIVISVLVFIYFIYELNYNSLSFISKLSKYSLYVILIGDYPPATEIIWYPFIKGIIAPNNCLLVIVYVMLVLIVSILIGEIIDKLYDLLFERIIYEKIEHRN